MTLADAGRLTELARRVRNLLRDMKDSDAPKQLRDALVAEAEARGIPKDDLNLARFVDDRGDAPKIKGEAEALAKMRQVSAAMKTPTTEPKVLQQADRQSGPWYDVPVGQPATMRFIRVVTRSQQSAAVAVAGLGEAAPDVSMALAGIRLNARRARELERLVQEKVQTQARKAAAANAPLPAKKQRKVSLREG